MNKEYYIHNNEALVSCIVYEIVSRTKCINAAKLSVIVAFLLDDKIVYKLKRLIDINILFFIRNNIKTIGNFNNKYLASLPVLINSSVLLKNVGIIDFELDNLIILKKIDFDFSDSGNRMKNILEIIDKTISLFENVDNAQLFNDLKIIL